ncbi:MAG: hypothetical protein ABSG72_03440 [Candidatus Sulfotelmatobacter sp.]|jgi:hypothetical protein
MEKPQFTLFLFGLFLVAWFALSCGRGASPANIGPIQPGRLQAITVSPVAADAQDYPGGQVAFVATGTYVNPAGELTPQPALWGACQQNASTSEVSVTNAGVAQCLSGASGSYTVFAYQPTECLAINACGGGCTVVGTAQLTCP